MPVLPWYAHSYESYLTVSLCMSNTADSEYSCKPEAPVTPVITRANTPVSPALHWLVCRLLAPQSLFSWMWIFFITSKHYYCIDCYICYRSLSFASPMTFYKPAPSDLLRYQHLTCAVRTLLFLSLDPNQPSAEQIRRRYVNSESTRHVEIINRPKIRISIVVFSDICMASNTRGSHILHSTFLQLPSTCEKIASARFVLRSDDSHRRPLAPFEIREW